MRRSPIHASASYLCKTYVGNASLLAVEPEANVRNNMRVRKGTNEKALKPRPDVTRSPKQMCQEENMIPTDRA